MDESRKIILARRARFIAAAFASAGLFGQACGGQTDDAGQPLDPEAGRHNNGGTGASNPCLSISGWFNTAGSPNGGAALGGAPLGGTGGVQSAGTGGLHVAGAGGAGAGPCLSGAGPCLSGAGPCLSPPFDAGEGGTAGEGAAAGEGGAAGASGMGTGAGDGGTLAR